MQDCQHKWLTTKEWPHRVKCDKCQIWYESDEEFKEIEANRGIQKN